ncbi:MULTISPECIES: helix-turn-helix domain-containing protein [unclassified Crossiella]|uniref:helix-turn-helix domain-containing protein n=1 Tax=unclassified Crossiella TaxID=2620835 RepID=UPI001FFF7ECC|nr:MULTISPECIES: helix-turn-helix domain-containing protein [unclassified Crossiella]MCK2242916.1 helix-turn-helix domain-containing protein [Crossiella sp. S99.2]MCK2256793.1 helix-turn-helix domain-containing protein [Crossiella sp. S99.1]
MTETWVRTMDLPAKDRFDYWYYLATLGWGEITVEVPDTTDFRSVGRLVDLGGMLMTTEELQPVRVDRSAAQVRRSDPERWHLTLLAEGSSRFEQDGRQAGLSAGDLLIYHSSAPFRCTVTSSKTEFLQFPRELNPAGLESLVSMPFSGRAGIGALVAGCLRELAALPGNQPEEASRLTAVTLDLLGVLSARVRGDSAAPAATPAALITTVRAFIRANLADPELDPAAIAAAHHISVRYLHRLFQQEGQTVAGWIRERRLENCRRDLANPALRERPVHAVARRWGFTDSAHFSRAFRSAFGLPPGEYRRLVQTGAQPS